MAYRIAGIDVHKKMVAVVIADVDVLWCHAVILRLVSFGSTGATSSAYR